LWEKKREGKKKKKKKKNHTPQRTKSREEMVFCYHEQSEQVGWTGSVFRGKKLARQNHVLGVEAKSDEELV